MGNLKLHKLIKLKLTNLTITNLEQEAKEILDHLFENPQSLAQIDEHNHTPMQLLVDSTTQIPQNNTSWQHLETKDKPTYVDLKKRLLLSAAITRCYLKEATKINIDESDTLFTTFAPLVTKLPWNFILQTLALESKSNETFISTLNWLTDFDSIVNTWKKETKDSHKHNIALHFIKVLGEKELEALCIKELKHTSYSKHISDEEQNELLNLTKFDLTSKDKNGDTFLDRALTEYNRLPSGSLSSKYFCREVILWAVRNGAMLTLAYDSLDATIIDDVLETQFQHACAAENESHALSYWYNQVGYERARRTISPQIDVTKFSELPEINYPMEIKVLLAEILLINLNKIASEKQPAALKELLDEIEEHGIKLDDIPTDTLPEMIKKQLSTRDIANKETEFEKCNQNSQDMLDMNDEQLQKLLADFPTNETPKSGKQRPVENRPGENTFGVNDLYRNFDENVLGLTTVANSLEEETQTPYVTKQEDDTNPTKGSKPENKISEKSLQTQQDDENEEPAKTTKKSPTAKTPAVTQPSDTEMSNQSSPTHSRSITNEKIKKQLENNVLTPSQPHISTGKPVIPTPGSVRTLSASPKPKTTVIKKFEDRLPNKPHNSTIKPKTKQTELNLVKNSSTNEKKKSKPLSRNETIKVLQPEDSNNVEKTTLILQPNLWQRFRTWSREYPSTTIAVGSIITLSLLLSFTTLLAIGITAQGGVFMGLSSFSANLGTWVNNHPTLSIIANTFSFSTGPILFASLGALLVTSIISITAIGIAFLAIQSGQKNKSTNCQVTYLIPTLSTMQKEIPNSSNNLFHKSTDNYSVFNGHQQTQTPPNKIIANQVTSEASFEPPLITLNNF